MDIQLTDTGDLHSQNFRIDGWRQALQSVVIRIHRFKGEWILDQEAGLDYLDWKDRKRGNLLAEIRDRMTTEVLKVKGVLRVDDLAVRLDPTTREVDIQANIVLADEESPAPVLVFMDTWEGTTRVQRT